MAQSYRARSQLLSDPIVAPFVDQLLPIPRPFLGQGAIKLVVIGQDPTVQRESSRETIRTVLNLDKRGSLRTYLEKICAALGISLDNEVYATNACKNFYTAPPTTIEQKHDIDILAASAHAWLPVLNVELAQFPNAVIISLGQPVLSVLVSEVHIRKMAYYWGHQPGWKNGHLRPPRAILASESALGRVIFPVVHQPSLRGYGKLFYTARMDEYLAFIRQQIAFE